MRRTAIGILNKKALEKKARNQATSAGRQLPDSSERARLLAPRQRFNAQRKQFAGSSPARIVTNI